LSRSAGRRARADHSRAPSLGGARHLLLPLLIAAIAAANEATAQVVAGTVRDRTTGTTVPNAVVTLLDSATDRVVGRILSSDSGLYRIAAGVPGVYRLQVKRVGVEPFRSAPFALAAGEQRMLELAVSDVIVPLARVQVQSPDVCGDRAARAEQTARLLEEIRTALEAVVLARRAGDRHAVVTTYVREVESGNDVVRSEDVSTTRGVIARPFVSVPADSVAAGGYVRDLPDGSTLYLAPDPDVLGSVSFLATHCFGRTLNIGDSLLVGLSFRPVPTQQLPDIEGTLWVDRLTARLRELDARDTRLPHEVEDSRIGIRMTFRQRPGGQWIVSTWLIRAPLITQIRSRRTRLGKLSVDASERDSLTGLHEEGGFADFGDSAASLYGRIDGHVSLTHRSDSVLVLLAGTRRYLFAGGPDGHFVLDSVLGGRYRLTLSRASTATAAGGVRIVDALVRPGQPTRLDIQLSSGPVAVADLCGASRARDAPSALQLFIRDPVRRHGVSALPFVLRTARQEVAGVDRVQVRTGTENGRTSSDGMYLSCKRVAGERVELAPPALRGSLRRDLGVVRRGALEVFHILVPGAGQ
jgi:Carboxypeptidase regulatory-like domain